MIVVHILGFMLVACSLAQTDPRADAVLAAISAYERSTHTIRWTQRVFIPPSTHEDEGTTWKMTWKMMLNSERFAGEDWSWFLLERDDPGPTPDPEVEYQRLYFGKAGLRVTAGLTFRKGMLALNDGFFTSGVHLWRALGRGLDYQTHTACRSLEDLLRQADSVVYVEPANDLPWPGVRARTTDPARWFMDVEVRIDPALGGMPRAYISRVPDGWAAERMEVLEAGRFGEFWLPVIGAHAVFYPVNVQDASDPVPERRRLDIERARSGAGLPPELNTDEVRRCIERLIQVRAIDADRGLFLAPLTITTNNPLVVPQIFVVDHAEVNVPMSIDRMFEHVSADARMFNGCTGEWTDVEGIRRFWKGLHQ
jgi:hypothetical protein